MASLLDVIRRNSANMSATASQPAPDQTYQAQELLRARSGKSVGPTSAPRASNLGERQATVGGQQALIPIQQEQQLASTALSGQAAEIQQARENLRRKSEQQERFQSADAQMRTTQLLSDLEGEKAKLGAAQDRAKLEQVAFGLAMADKQYIENLQTAGQRLRLDNDLAFREELSRAVFGDTLDLMKEALDTQSILDMSNREFSERMAQLDIGHADRMADIQLDQMSRKNNIDMENLRSQYRNKAVEIATQNRAAGVSSLLEGASKAVSIYGDSQDKKNSGGGN